MWFLICAFQAEKRKVKMYICTKTIFAVLCSHRNQSKTPEHISQQQILYKLCLPVNGCAVRQQSRRSEKPPMTKGEGTAQAVERLLKNTTT